MSDKRLDCFVSWNSSDTDFKNKIVDLLEGKDISLYNSDRDTYGNWKVEFINSAKQALFLVAIISKESIEKSTEMDNEIKAFLESNKIEFKGCSKEENDELKEYNILPILKDVDIPEAKILAEKREEEEKKKDPKFVSYVLKLLKHVSCVTIKSNTFGKNEEDHIFKKSKKLLKHGFVILAKKHFKKLSNLDIRDDFTFDNLEVRCDYIDRINIDEMINSKSNKNHFILVGEAGTGKSTYLKIFNNKKNSSHNSELSFYFKASTIAKEFDYCDGVASTLVNILDKKLKNIFLDNDSLMNLTSIFRTRYLLNSSLNSIWILIDGLDEIINKNNKINLIKECRILSDNSEGKIHFLFSSRIYEDEVKNWFYDDDNNLLLNKIICNNFSKDEIKECIDNYNIKNSNSDFFKGKKTYIIDRLINLNINNPYNIQLQTRLFLNKKIEDFSSNYYESYKRFYEIKEESFNFLFKEKKINVSKVLSTWAYEKNINGEKEFRNIFDKEACSEKDKNILEKDYIDLVKLLGDMQIFEKDGHDFINRKVETYYLSQYLFYYCYNETNALLSLYNKLQNNEKLTDDLFINLLTNECLHDSLNMYLLNVIKQNENNENDELSCLVCLKEIINNFFNSFYEQKNKQEWDNNCILFSNWMKLIRYTFDSENRLIKLTLDILFHNFLKKKDNWIFYGLITYVVSSCKQLEYLMELVITKFESCKTVEARKKIFECIPNYVYLFNIDVTKEKNIYDKYVELHKLFLNINEEVNCKDDRVNLFYQDILRYNNKYSYIVNEKILFAEKKIIHELYQNVLNDISISKIHSKFAFGTLYVDDINKLTNMDLNNILCIYIKGNSECSIIPKSIFRWNSSLRNVYLDEISKIDDKAFASSNLNNVYIYSSNNTTINQGSFLSCKLLKLFYCNAKVKKINDSCFEGCNLLNKVIIKGVTEVGNNAFNECFNLEFNDFNNEKKLPSFNLKNINKLGRNAFAECRKIKIIELSNDLRIIPKSCFEGCRSLEGVKCYIIEKIDDFAFKECSKLREVDDVIGGAMSIGVEAFSKCNEIINVRFSGNLLKYQCFHKCKRLKHLHIASKNKITIEKEAFCNCHDLISCVIETKNDIYLNKYSFKYCIKLNSLYLKAKDIEIDKGVFLNCFELELINVIKGNIRKIGPFAFRNVNNFNRYLGDKIDFSVIHELAFNDSNVKEVINRDKTILQLNDQTTELNKNCNNQIIDRCCFITNQNSKPDFSCDIVNIKSNIDIISVNDVILFKEYKKIIIDEGIIKIDDACFEGFLLEEIYFPKSLRKINKNAFKNCKNLTKVNLFSVYSIGISSFEGCESLQQVYLGEHKSLIVNNKAFYNCISLEEIISNVGRLVISLESFKNCTKINTLKLNCQSIDISCFAFENCTSMKNVELCLENTESYSCIDSYAFKNCSNIKSISINSRFNLSIKRNAFDNNLHLVNLKISPNVYMESDCMPYIYQEICNVINLKKKMKKDSITNEYIFKESFDKFGYSNLFIPKEHCQECYKILVAFKGNSYINKITFEEGITSIPERALINIKCKEIVLPSTLKYIGASAFAYNTQLEKINLPTNLLQIGPCAFRFCRKIDNVVLPDNLITLEDQSFEGCYSLKNIKLPNKLEVIKRACFYNCGIEEMVLPKSVKNVEGAVFEMSNITKIDLSKTEINRISGSMFKNATNLEQVILNNVISEIGNYAFFGTSNLSKISNLNNLKVIDEEAFKGSGVTNIDFLNECSDLFINKEAFAESKLCGKVILPQNVILGNGAFARTKIEEIEYYGEIVYNNAFIACKYLKTIKLPNCHTIKENAFSNCGSLESIEAKKVRSLGEEAFYKCVQLKHCKFESVNEIGNKAFANNFELKSIVFPNIRSLNNEAFYNCKKLEKIDLENCEYIGKGVFNILSKKCSIIVPNLSEISENIFSNPYFNKNAIMINTSNEMKKQIKKIGLLFKLNEWY